uniref:D-alanyl-D-alanine carboxypeptidase family protein n=1 Tax=Acetatifactor sp. TaxID=1872090 RepID=UPI0040575B4E
MRCISRRFLSLGLAFIAAISLTACGNLKYEMPYNPDSEVSGFNVISGKTEGTVEAFAADLCVVTDDILDDENVDMSRATAAVLFDVNNKEVIYSKNAHERLYPASLTKVMTALVALQNGSLDQVLTATDKVRITESGAQLCGLKSGDTMTLDQALHILLMYSANDVAMLIAENIGGTPEHFMEMMNEEAKRLGATNTNFMNPHGLTEDGHYTTAYDLYLIFNEAIKYEKFSEIIHMTNYQTTYTDQAGNTKEVSFRNSNLFLRGDYNPPENVSVIGGKTGTTNAAGSCLMLLSRDANGASYISIILQSEARDILYPEMIDLLDEINK